MPISSNVSSMLQLQLKLGPARLEGLVWSQNWWSIPYKTN